MALSADSRVLRFPGRIALLVAFWAGPVSSAAEPPAADPWPVTHGAAPGYVDDRACESCHWELWASYQEVAMSKAFYRPGPERVIEDLGATFHHRASDRYYEMELVDGRYRMRRYQLDEGGEPIHELEQEVDWILGSGNHSRTYLFRTPGGELFQLPIAWYSQTGSWGMAPGYDKPHHLGSQRRVRRECMFCHNAYPDVAAGSDRYGEPDHFPQDLPSGLGCQRCHGPGAVHAAAARVGDLDLALSTIVNPGDLEPERRDDICFGCHLQPSVALIGVRRFGRGDYSFRPGQDLAEYQVQLDVVEGGRAYEERFEINHHPYRLRQSRCFTESAGALSCLTCHDPHRKVPVEDRPAWYGARCAGCHVLAETEAHRAADPGYCIPCHMPERRTQDVVLVTMTDHRIQRRPPGPEAVAPLEEHDPILVDASFLFPERALPGALAGAHRAASVVRTDGGVNAAAVDHLERFVAAEDPEELDPWLYLAKGQLGRQRHEAFEATAREIFARAPDHSLALEWLALSRHQRGRGGEAIDLLRRAVAAPGLRPESFFNLGLILAEAGKLDEARESLERSLSLRPNLSAGWFYLGKVDQELGRNEEALAGYRRALALDPGLERAYVALARLLLGEGERSEAMRYLRHGARAAREPGPVAELLREELEAGNR